MQTAVLAFTEEEILARSEVLDVIRELQNEAVELCDPQIVTKASSLSNLLHSSVGFHRVHVLGQLAMESSSIDIVISISRSLGFPGDKLFEEISRVLKPGGTILVYKYLKFDKEEATKEVSALEHKLLLLGFLDAQTLQLKSVAQTEVVQSFGVKGKKPSWKIGSSFPIKKTSKCLFKLQVDEDYDLIDEETLLTEDDLKKPQLPSSSDCEVGSTRKACKNCTCGRAEAEEKVQKLGLTTDQLNNPRSACGRCGLGDAFRCSSCPYKGLPPFKLGDKVALPGNFLVADT